MNNRVILYNEILFKLKLKKPRKSRDTIASVHNAPPTSDIVIIDGSSPNRLDRALEHARQHIKRGGSSTNPIQSRTTTTAARLIIDLIHSNDNNHIEQLKQQQALWLVLIDVNRHGRRQDDDNAIEYVFILIVFVLVLIAATLRPTSPSSPPLHRTTAHFNDHVDLLDIQTTEQRHNSNGRVIYDKLDKCQPADDNAAESYSNEHIDDGPLDDIE